MIHRMNLQDGPFSLIEQGTKTIEMRLYDEKRRKINVGDEILFWNDHTSKVINTIVVNLHIFKSFGELYDSFDKISIGYKENEIPSPTDMEQYYSNEDINKYGVVGIEIKKII